MSFFYIFCKGSLEITIDTDLCKFKKVQFYEFNEVYSSILAKLHNLI